MKIKLLTIVLMLIAACSSDNEVSKKESPAPVNPPANVNPPETVTKTEPKTEPKIEPKIDPKVELAKRALEEATKMSALLESPKLEEPAESDFDATEILVVQLVYKELLRENLAVFSGLIQANVLENSETVDEDTTKVEVLFSGNEIRIGDMRMELSSEVSSFSSKTEDMTLRATTTVDGQAILLDSIENKNLQRFSVKNSTVEFLMDQAIETVDVSGTKTAYTQSESITLQVDLEFSSEVFATFVPREGKNKHGRLLRRDKTQNTITVVKGIPNQDGTISFPLETVPVSSVVDLVDLSFEERPIPQSNKREKLHSFSLTQK